MKGIESLQSMIFLIASVAAALILITLTVNFVGPKFEKEHSIKGEKEDVVKRLVGFIHRCWQENKGSLKTKVCFKISLKSRINFTENEIREKLDPTIIEKERVKVDNITGPTNLVIQYQVDFISVESR